MSVDRLAWGYTKEELRDLWKTRSDDGALVQVFHPHDLPFSKGNLSESSLREYQQKIRSGMDSLGAFGLETSRAKLFGTNATANIKSFYYWKKMMFELNPIAEPEKDSHTETLLGLSHINFALDRKRLVVDEIECSLLMNDHTLYRMVERGCVQSRPLAFINSIVHDWFPFAATCIVGRSLIPPNHSVLVPCGPGAFLCKVSFTQSTYTDRPSGDASRPFQPTHLHRLTMNTKSRSLSDIPGPDLLQTKYGGNDGRGSLHISTWVHQNQFSTDQWWCFQRINELIKEYYDIMRINTYFIHSFHEGTLDMERATEFTERFADSINNPRWERATRL